MTLTPQLAQQCLEARARQLLDKLLDHDLPYSAQTGAAQIVDDLLTALREALASPAKPQAEHRQGCEVLGGYGHGVGTCTCGASLASGEGDEARDAARWRAFIGLEYKVRAEWAANLSLAPVLTEWVDQRVAAMKGNGK